MKILHSADWHLDSPLQGRTPEQAGFLRRALLEIPGKVAAVCREEGCDLMLLAGDLFDGPYSKESLNVLRSALEEAAVPVFISPGNHDFCGACSPWTTESWPENVHIFTRPILESVAVPRLDCRVYGAGYDSMDCAPLLENFHADGSERHCIGVLHGDPAQTASPYCPITAQQVQESGLEYLALGHIHKGGSFRAGAALCAWPGCPMGRGFDELGPKGVLVVTLEDTAEARFVPLDTPRFFDLEAEAGQDPAGSLASLLPPAGSADFYRVTFTGPSEALNLSEIAAQFPRFPNLELRDRTAPPVDLWGAVGDDTLEGVYFRLLRDAMEGQEEASQRRILLAAQISRQILDGQEVKLP